MRRALAILWLCGLVLTACVGQTGRSPYRFYIPKDYVGWVQVEFQVSDAPPLPTEGEYRVVRFPATGIARTSSAIGSYPDYVKYGDPNTANPVIGPITPAQ